MLRPANSEHRPRVLEKREAADSSRWGYNPVLDDRSDFTHSRSLSIRKRTTLGPYSRPVPRVLGGYQGCGRFLMGKVPLQSGPRFLGIAAALCIRSALGSLRSCLRTGVPRP